MLVGAGGGLETVEEGLEAAGVLGRETVEERVEEGLGAAELLGLDTG